MGVRVLYIVMGTYTCAPLNGSVNPRLSSFGRREGGRMEAGAQCMEEKSGREPNTNALVCFEAPRSQSGFQSLSSR